jgi:predicted DNA-binding protein
MPKPNLHGVRTNLVFPRPIHTKLKALSSKTGLTMAEHVRRALEMYLRSVTKIEE